MSTLEQTYRENAVEAREKVKEVHDTLNHLDQFVRNGMNGQLNRVAATQKALWWFVTAIFLGVAGIAFAVVRTSILEHLK